MTNRIQKTLRWIAVLPGSVAAGIASTFLLHFILYLTLTKIVTPYPELPERVITPFIIAITFIQTGCEIAPTNKLKVGIVLFSIWMFLAGGFVMTTLTSGKWFGKNLSLEANGISPIMGILGAFVGLYLVRNKNRERQTIPLQEDVHIDENTFKQQGKTESASLYNKYKAEIFNLVFIVLFLLCIFFTTSRYIVFILLLLFSLFLVIFSIKEKLYTTTVMKINLGKDILMIIALVFGLLNREAGLYVSVLCLALYTTEFIRGIIVTHMISKSSATVHK